MIFFTFQSLYDRMRKPHGIQINIIFKILNMKHLMAKIIILMYLRAWLKPNQFHPFFNNEKTLWLMTSSFLIMIATSMMKKAYPQWKAIKGFESMSCYIFVVFSYMFKHWMLFCMSLMLLNYTNKTDPNSRLRYKNGKCVCTQSDISWHWLPCDETE